MAASAPSFDWSKLLGPQLVQPDETSVNTAERLGSVDVVGLYFSAHWCPPCRQFTPRLSQVYKKLKTQGKSFEFVFISWDRDDVSWSEYLSEMPWVALPFDQKDTIGKALSKKHKVQGIPHLILFNGKTGEIICKNATNAIRSDPTAAGFPFPRVAPLDILKSGKLLSKSGEIDGAAGLGGKYTLIYFSAHWCPPCRHFTPQLVAWYQNLRRAGREDMEVVFVSSDRSAEGFTEYYSTMPWLALPWRDPRAGSLSQEFDVQGIPTLVILDEGKLVTAEGVAKVSGDPTGSGFPYPPLPMENMDLTTECYGINIAAHPAVLLFLDNVSDKTQQDSDLAELMPVALKYAEAPVKAGGLPTFLFFFSRSPNEISERVQKFLGLELTDKPLLIIADIQSKQSFTFPFLSIDRQNVEDWLEAYLGGTLKEFSRQALLSSLHLTDDDGCRVEDPLSPSCPIR